MKEDDRPLDLRIKREWNLSRTGSIETDLRGKTQKKNVVISCTPVIMKKQYTKEHLGEVTTLKKNNNNNGAIFKIQAFNCIKIKF